jgi:hypothetical protein
MPLIRFHWFICHHTQRHGLRLFPLRAFSLAWFSCRRIAACFLIVHATFHGPGRLLNSVTVTIPTRHFAATAIGEQNTPLYLGIMHFRFQDIASRFQRLVSQHDHGRPFSLRSRDVPHTAITSGASAISANKQAITEISIYEFRIHFTYFFMISFRHTDAVNRNFTFTLSPPLRPPTRN